MMLDREGLDPYDSDLGGVARNLLPRGKEVHGEQEEEEENEEEEDAGRTRATRGSDRIGLEEKLAFARQLAGEGA